MIEAIYFGIFMLLLLSIPVVIDKLVELSQKYPILDDWIERILKK